MRKMVLKLTMVLSISLPVFSSDDKQDAVFVDNATALMWQDDEQAKITKKPWVTESNYASNRRMDTSGDTATTYCSNLSLSGYTDWRLPTKDELLGLNYKELKNVNTMSHWSSSANQHNQNSVFHVDFIYKHTGSDLKYSKKQVRCVRNLLKLEKKIEQKNNIF